MSYFETTIKNVEDVYRIFMLPEKHVFRGQKKYSWGLNTTFERAAKDIDRKNWDALEQKIILEFKRKTHQYISDLPQSEIEWLALMQHFGSPTRLLDFTRSFFVALYFAVENTDCDSAVWAIDTSYFINRPEPAYIDYLLSTYCKEAVAEVDEIFTKNNNSKSGIIFVEPFRQNQRLSIQKGVFVLSKNIQNNIEGEIKENIKLLRPKNDSNIVVQKIKIPQSMHLEIITLLDKMNINHATLFPGLEGFAKSQITHIKMAQHHEDSIRKLRENALKFGTPLKKD